MSAEAIEPTCEVTASALHTLAMTELIHQSAVERDLVELRGSSGWAAALVDSIPSTNPALSRHMRLRRLVPATTDPFVVLALEVEFAALDLSLGRNLLDALSYTMPARVDARRLLRIRTHAASRRLEEGAELLRMALRRQPTRAVAWAEVGAQLVHSYLDVVEGYGPQRLARRFSSASTITSATTSATMSLHAPN